MKTAFLHGDLEEEIYMQQPKGLEVKGKKKSCMQAKEELVCTQASTKTVV